MHASPWSHSRVPHAVEDPAVGGDAFPDADGIVSAGVDVDQQQHVDDGADGADVMRHRQQRVHSVHELPVRLDLKVTVVRREGEGSVMRVVF